MRRVVTCGLFLLYAAWTNAALGQHADDFESLNGSAEGADLNGQGGYYLPPAGGTTAKVYTYDNNVLGIPGNPNGGSQFVGGRGPGNGVYVRSQLDIAYGDGTGVWNIAVDVCHNHDGVVPRSQYIGSFSTQVYPGAKGAFILLSSFTDINSATTWDADMGWFDADNIEHFEKVANPAFQNLAFNHWYRRTATVDLDTNLILEVGIEDLSTGQKARFQPLDRYGSGGRNGGPAPTGFRFFAGTTPLAGNTMVFDNVQIEGGEGGSCCSYTITKSKASGGCQTCPPRNSIIESENGCETIQDCPKKFESTIECPNGPGTCIMKGKHRGCERDAPCVAEKILKWDADGRKPKELGGTGDWDTESPRWWDGQNYLTWTNANAAAAGFGGNSGQVTTKMDVTVSGISFSTTGYEIAGTKVITLAGRLPISFIRLGRASGFEAEITATLAGNKTLYLGEIGQLTLSGINTYTGDIINQGVKLIGGYSRNQQGDGPFGRGVISLYSRYGVAELRLKDFNIISNSIIVEKPLFKGGTPIIGITGDGGVTFLGDIELRDKVILQADGSNGNRGNVTITGEIKGAGQVVIPIVPLNSSSVVELNRPDGNSYNGGTTVEGGGRLHIQNERNSATGTGPVRVYDDGLLDVPVGATISGPLTVEASGELRVTLARLKTGSLTLKAGSRLVDARLTGIQDKPPISVTGRVDIEDSILTFQLAFVPQQIGDKCVLIMNDNNDRVRGPFKDMPEGTKTILDYDNKRFELEISYQGNIDGGRVANDIVFTVTRIIVP